MIVSKFSIQHFKSIESAELELGHINVFIGANGSGKSNLMEAFGVLAAAAFGRIDEESMIRRGCRRGGFFRPQFRDTPAGIETVLHAESEGNSYKVALLSPETGPSKWTFNQEIWSSGGRNLVDRSTLVKGMGDPQIGLAALKLAETPPDSTPAKFVKTLAAYSIYAPDTPMLRGEISDPQVREPVGLSGGRLAEAVLELPLTAGDKLHEELQSAVVWFDGFGIMKKTDEKNFSPARHQLLFIDKFFATEKTDGGKNRWNFLGQNDVNEGVLYQLFLGVLCLDPSAPALFAVDNGDHGLNPLLAKHLIQTMCEWLLNGERPRQVLMTTHNPLVLDGLPLQDDRVRLFTVDRDNLGKTIVKRVEINEKLLSMAAKGWSLSRLWTNKLIGGMPNV